eukprot:CAMPEP_0194450148 /NCGR_PEP_ID=MMETSP0176-20130528/130552_1 /TAXON_ID=216777 /ORGANISM="Proboscia alata, Strain PI-D3" /LENGTH=144 /DNA_ID=CAMNT_0039277377 /DNA_START=592 /DNA_END=1029 /DNA_ORIENTATION=+
MKQELESFWSKHKSKDFPIPPIPDVDFEGDHAVVAAVFSGLKSSGGYGIEMKSVSVNEKDDVVIHYETNKPSPDSIVSDIPTQPFHIVELMLPQELNQKNQAVKFYDETFVPQGDSDASAGEKRAGWISLTVPTFLFVGYHVFW